MILIIYAILLSGKIYLPLDKSYPIDKINYYLKQSDCKYIITDSKIIFNNSKLNIIKLEYLLKDHYSELSENSYIFNPISYIIYTSGTTGNPQRNIK